MWKDPIVEEIREARDRLAGRFGYDLGALVEYLRAREKDEPADLIRRGATVRKGSSEKTVSPSQKI